MTFQIRQAERRKARLRLALIGPSGSGKTLSALLIAYGLTEDWTKIGLIDTEQGSGELYAGSTTAGLTIGAYQYGRITAPFEVPKYLDAIHTFEAALGPEGIVVVDSLSHAWAAEGGLLERVDTIAGRGNKWAAWRDVTPLHNALVEAMLQSPSHVIATMRTKSDYVVEDDERGKKVPKKVGLAPVQREGLDYEFTVVLDLDAKHFASVSKDRTGLFDGVLAKPTPAMGQRLREWLDRGVEAVPPQRPARVPEAPGNGSGPEAADPELGTLFGLWRDVYGDLKPTTADEKIALRANRVRAMAALVGHPGLASWADLTPEERKVAHDKLTVLKRERQERERQPQPQPSPAPSPVRRQLERSLAEPTQGDLAGTVNRGRP